MIGAHGAQLIDWLEKYTYVAEQQYADKRHARAAARTYIDENLRNGITTAAVFCTVHPQSVDALFEAAAKLDLRLIAGKVMMDRNAPEALRDTAQRGYDESKALIAKWHGTRRLAYAVTPRFAAIEHAGADGGGGRPVARVAGHLSPVARLREPPRGRVGEGALPRAQGLPRRLRPLRPARTARDLRPRHLAHRGRAPRAATRPAPRSRTARRRTSSSAAAASTSG